MKRRSFLALGAAGTTFAGGEEKPTRLPPPSPGQRKLEESTPGASPAIVLNHLGFRPDGRKLLVVRGGQSQLDAHFTLEEVGSVLKPFNLKRPLQMATGDWQSAVADFSDVTRVGMYQITVNGERSVPFFIRPDVWRRTLPRAVGYHKYQRCGVEVPNVHPICHLDDARRRDTGEHVDVSGGGWHDAGDLRKWMDVTMLNAIGMLHIVRNLGSDWDAAGTGLALLYQEVRWGNRYFLKMQDADGLVFADVAGGKDGDNSDNHWTDNIVGTADDRYLNVAKPDGVQPVFVVLEAMMSQAFASVDAEYAETCLKAAVRCWRAAQNRPTSSLVVAWWTLAALELWRATGSEEFHTAALCGAATLTKLQNTTFAGDQKKIRGFWLAANSDPTPYCQAVYSALPGIALAQLLKAWPNAPEAADWRDALTLHIDEYVLPLAARSTYSIVPYGVFYGSPTPETYRPLAGNLTYRYFMPTRKEYWWLGINSHLECYATFLAEASHVLNRRDCRDLAYRQLEWVMGGNPFSSCLMTGEGIRNPFPHSRYVGLIPGGIMNGIAGNLHDEPILDLANEMDWRTAEYWSPQNAYYEWALSTLETPD